jgi:hypothetical protein
MDSSLERKKFLTYRYANIPSASAKFSSFLHKEFCLKKEIIIAMKALLNSGFAFLSPKVITDTAACSMRNQKY